MNNPKWISFSWARGFDDDDDAWAKSYLLAKGVSSAYHLQDKPSLPLLENNPLNREIEAKLRNAWRQRKARKKLRGRKAYNFILSDISKRKLDRIADEMHSSLSDALANVIELETQRATAHDTALKEFKKKTKEQKKAFGEEVARKDRDIFTLHQTLNFLSNALDLVSMRLARASVLLESPTAQHLPVDMLKELTVSEYTKIREKIRQDLGLNALALRYPNNAEELWEKVINESGSVGQKDISETLQQP